MAAPKDRVQLSKRESAARGGDAADEDDFLVTLPLEPNEDAPEVAGIFIQAPDPATSKDELVYLTRDSSDNMIFRDDVDQTERTLTELLGSGVFGTEYADVYDTVVSTTTSTAFQEKVSLSVTSIPTGRYRVEISYQWNHDQTSSDFEAQLQQDDTTTLMFHKEEPKDSAGSFGVTGTSQRLGFTKVVLINLNSGSYTFDLDFRTDAVDQESSIWDAAITFWRVS